MGGSLRLLGTLAGSIKAQRPARIMLFFPSIAQDYCTLFVPVTRKITINCKNSEKGLVEIHVSFGRNRYLHIRYGIRKE